MDLSDRFVETPYKKPKGRSWHLGRALCSWNDMLCPCLWPGGGVDLQPSYQLVLMALGTALPKNITVSPQGVSKFSKVYYDVRNWHLRSYTNTACRQCQTTVTCQRNRRLIIQLCIQWVLQYVASILCIISSIFHMRHALHMLTLSVVTRTF